MNLSSDKNYTADYKVYAAPHRIFGSMSHALRWLRTGNRFRRISRRQASQLPVGAISRRHRTQKAVPFFIALDLLIALDLPFAVMIAVWQAKLAGFWSRSHIRNNVIAGIIVGVVTAAQPPVDV